MHPTAYSIRLEFAVAASSAIAALLLYLPREAKATAFHDFYRHFVHLWGNVVSTALILVPCVLGVAASASVVRRGSNLQRVGAALVAACPVIILARFLLWVAHQWTAQ